MTMELDLRGVSHSPSERHPLKGGKLAGAHSASDLSTLFPLLFEREKPWLKLISQTSSSLVIGIAQYSLFAPEKWHDSPPELLSSALQFPSAPL
jgi:hypothetical protein